MSALKNRYQRINVYWSCICIFFLDSIKLTLNMPQLTWSPMGLKNIVFIPIIFHYFHLKMIVNDIIFHKMIKIVLFFDFKMIFQLNQEIFGAFNPLPSKACIMHLSNQPHSQFTNGIYHNYSPNGHICQFYSRL